MPGQVHDLEGAIAQIDYVTFRESASGGGRGNRIVARCPVLGGAGVEQQIARAGRVRCQVGTKGLGELARANRMKLKVWIHARCLEVMHHPLVEFVETADMVIVDMGCDGGQGPVDKVGDCPAKRRQAGASIHDQVAGAAANVPDVAADEGIEMGLPDPGNALAHHAALKPALGNFQHRASVPTQGVETNRANVGPRGRSRTIAFVRSGAIETWYTVESHGSIGGTTMANPHRHVLDGYKVLDFTQIVAGPTCTLML